MAKKPKPEVKLLKEIAATLKRIEKTMKRQWRQQTRKSAVKG